MSKKCDQCGKGTKMVRLPDTDKEVCHKCWTAWCRAVATEGEEEETT